MREGAFGRPFVCPRDARPEAASKVAAGLFVVGAGLCAVAMCSGMTRYLRLFRASHPTGEGLHPHKEAGKKILFGVFASAGADAVEAGDAEPEGLGNNRNRLPEATFREVEESAIPMTADILLVDDNAIQAATRKAILARTGRNVAVASDGEQALRILEEIGTDYPVSLVITDHLMPGMNGPEFVTKLRERYAQMPVLVLSGLAEAENDYSDLEVMFRVKPLPPEELLELVRELMARRIARTA
jgi:CheY-like chemotaxis protein